jgi:hypothetical protein
VVRLGGSGSNLPQKRSIFLMGSLSSEEAGSSENKRDPSIVWAMLPTNQETKIEVNTETWRRNRGETRNKRIQEAS